MVNIIYGPCQRYDVATIISLNFGKVGSQFCCAGAYGVGVDSVGVARGERNCLGEVGTHSESVYDVAGAGIVVVDSERLVVCSAKLSDLSRDVALAVAGLSYTLDGV